MASELQKGSAYCITDIRQIAIKKSSLAIILDEICCPEQIARDSYCKVHSDFSHQREGPESWLN